MAVREGKARSGALIARGWAITTLGSLKEKLGHFFLRSGTNLISTEELPVVSRRDAGPFRQGEGQSRDTQGWEEVPSDHTSAAYNRVTWKGCR